MIEDFNTEERDITTPETAPVVEVTPIEEATPISAPAVVVEAPAPTVQIPAPKKAKKQPATPKVEKKVAGMYHNGRRITAVPARLGSKWTVIIDGKKQKVLKRDIEVVK